MKPGSIIKFSKDDTYWSFELRGKLGLITEVRQSRLFYGAEGPRLEWDVLVNSKVLKSLFLPEGAKFFEVVYETR
jgi:hypothetical protein